MIGAPLLHNACRIPQNATGTKHDPRCRQKGLSSLITIQSVTLFPINLVSELLALAQPPQIKLHDRPDALKVTLRGGADMRSDDDVLSAPQGVAVGEGFRVRDVQRSTADEPLVEGLDQVPRVDNGAAGNIGDKSPPPREHLELGRGDEPRRLVRQRHRDDEQVEAGAEELVQLLLGLAKEPPGREDALWVPEPRGGVRLVPLRLRRPALVEGVGVDLHPEGGGHPGRLPPDGAVAQDTSVIWSGMQGCYWFAIFTYTLFLTASYVGSVPLSHLPALCLSR